MTREVDTCSFLMTASQTTLYYDLKIFRKHTKFSIIVIPETEEPGGLQSTGSHRVGHDFSDSAHMYPFLIFMITTGVCQSNSPLPVISVLCHATQLYSV